MQYAGLQLNRIKMSENVVSLLFMISDFIQPICLPYDHDTSENYVKSTKEQGLEFDVFVAGWGATNERGRDPADALQKLNVPIFEADKCKKLYATRGGDLDIDKQVR